MSYIGQGLPADTFQGFVTDSFTGDGSATTFTLSKEPFSEDTLIVVINNVMQKPTTNFTVSGTTLTIVGTAVASGDVIYAIHMGGPLPIGGAAELDLNGASDKLILDADADTTISADTDDQIDFKAGGTDIMSLTATTATINDGATITVADNTDNLTLTSTDADANAGPNLRLYRNSSSAAPNDVIGVIEIEGRNDNSEDIIYQQYQHLIADETDGTEDGYFIFSQMRAGTLTERYRFETGTFVVNDPGNDFDTRIEGSSDANLFFVDASTNKVGIGTNAPDNKLHVSASDTVFRGINSNSTANFQNFRLYSGVGGADTETFRIENDGDVKNTNNSYGSLSDERIKQDITDANSQWDDIKSLKIKNYKRKDQVAAGLDITMIGVIAQDLEAAGMSGLVKESIPGSGEIRANSVFGTDEKNLSGVNVKSVKYSVLYMKAVKALQEAMTRIETLETKVQALEDNQ